MLILQGGIPSKQVGVMSVFRAQATLLHSHTKHSHGPDLEVSTIDQFQGKDKYVALLSCVRSCSQAAAGAAVSLLYSSSQLILVFLRGDAYVGKIVLNSQLYQKQFNKLMSMPYGKI